MKRLTVPARPWAVSRRLAVTALLAAGQLGSPALAESWRFQDLVREAANTHPTIMARRLAQDAAQAEVDATRWQRWPTPEFAVGQDDNGDHTTTLALQQPLWTGGRISAGIAAAESRHGASGEAVAEARQDILARLIDAYTEVRRRQAQQAIHYRNVQQHEKLKAMIARRVAREVSPQVDLELANSRLYQAANDLSLATQLLQHGLTRLSELTGRPVEAVAAEEGIVTALPARETVLEAALSASPVLARLVKERAAAEADVRSARADYWPLVAVRLERRDEFGETEERAMLVLQSQLGAGLSTRANVGAAVARRKALTEERAAAERALSAEVTEAWQQAAAARLRLENSRLNRESAATVFESYTRQYVIGQKSWLDVLNAVREASVAAIAVEDADAEQLRAGLRLQLLTGRLDPDRYSAGPSAGAEYVRHEG